MRKASGLENYRTCGEYYAFNNADRQHYKIIPHHLWRSKIEFRRHNRHDHALLVCMKGKNDWAVNRGAVESVYESEAVRGTIKKGYVLFVNKNNEVEATHTISEVWAVFKDRPIMDMLDGGNFGPYLFLTKELKVVNPGLVDSSL